MNRSIEAVARPRFALEQQHFTLTRVPEKTSPYQNTGSISGRIIIASVRVDQSLAWSPLGARPEVCAQKTDANIISMVQAAAVCG